MTNSVPEAFCTLLRLICLQGAFLSRDVAGHSFPLVRFNEGKWEEDETQLLRNLIP